MTMFGLGRLAESYKRARHSRGFGVHSPFAFAIVNLLRLRRGWGFYADCQITDTALKEGGRRLRRDALRFHRLCSRFADGTVFVSPDAPKAISLAALLASSRVRLTDDPTRIDECFGAYLTPACRHTALSGAWRFAMLAGFGEEDVMDIADSSDATLVLLGKRNAMLMRRDGMHRVCHTVNL